jgi:hypothetical protein
VATSRHRVVVAIVVGVVVAGRWMLVASVAVVAGTVGMLLLVAAAGMGHPDLRRHHHRHLRHRHHGVGVVIIIDIIIIDIFVLVSMSSSSSTSSSWCCSRSASRIVSRQLPWRPRTTEACFCMIVCMFAREFRVVLEEFDTVAKLTLRRSTARNSSINETCRNQQQRVTSTSAGNDKKQVNNPMNNEHNFLNV